MKIDKKIPLDELLEDWQNGLIEDVLIVATPTGWRVFAKNRKNAADDPRDFKVIEVQEGP